MSGNLLHSLFTAPYLFILLIYSTPDLGVPVDLHYLWRSRRFTWLMIIRRTAGLLRSRIAIRRTFGLLSSFSTVFAFSGEPPFLSSGLLQLAPELLLE